MSKPAVRLRQRTILKAAREKSKISCLGTVMSLSNDLNNYGSQKMVEYLQCAESNC